MLFPSEFDSGLEHASGSDLDDSFSEDEVGREDEAGPGGEVVEE